MSLILQLCITAKMVKGVNFVYSVSNYMVKEIRPFYTVTSFLIFITYNEVYYR